MAVLSIFRLGGSVPNEVEKAVQRAVMKCCNKDHAAAEKFLENFKRFEN